MNGRRARAIRQLAFKLTKAYNREGQYVQVVKKLKKVYYDKKARGEIKKDKKLSRMPVLQS